jgi:hypothetical protein
MVSIMSERLVKAMKAVIVKEGETGKGRLADSIGNKCRVIEAYIEGSRNPTPQNAYRLARYCGFSEKDALAIVEECVASKRQRMA